MSILAFTANAVSIEDDVIHTPTAVETFDQTYRNSQYGFSFHYPSDWQIQKDEASSKKLTVKSPEGFILAMSTIPGEAKAECDRNDQAEVGTDSISILGNELTIHLSGNKANNTVTHAYLLTSSEPCPASPFITIPSKGNISIELYQQNLPELPHNKFQADDYQSAKDILSSIKLIAQ